MIDVHCHILPGIDDGAKSFEDSLVILRKAEKAGVTDAILTPHYIVGSKYNADNAKKWQLFMKLRELAEASGISVRLYLGNEIYIDTELPEMLAAYSNTQTGSGNFGTVSGNLQTSSGNSQPASGKIYEISTLNSGRYVLVELPVGAEDKSAQSTLFALVRKGFIPVIAHPERYIYAQDNPNYFDDFLRMGCVLQGDYLALTGKYGKRVEKTLKKLLFMDKIFCLASDIHKTTDEYSLDVAEKKLLRIFKNDQRKVAELLTENPRKMLVRK